MFAQTISPSVYDELLYPDGTGGYTDIATVSHTSNYGYDKVKFVDNGGASINNLYVWTWGSVNVSEHPASGIAWRRTTPDATLTTLNQGHLLFDFLAYDPEVCFIQSSGTVYVVVAYYRSGDYYGDLSLAGHYYDIYKWTSTGLIPYSINNLLGLGSYKRISIDAISLNKISIVWQTDHGIGYKNMKSSNVPSSPISISPTHYIVGTTGYTRPDVALTHIYNGEGVLKSTLMNVLTVRPTAASTPEFHIMYQEFDDAFSGSTVFINDWNESLMCLYPLSFGVGPAMDGMHLQLDCPDSSTFNAWAMVYRFNNYVRSYIRHMPATIPSTIDLTEGYNSSGNGTAVAYDKNPKVVHFGFHKLKTNNGYFGVTYRTNGTKVGMPGVFKRIEKPIYAYQTVNTIAFNKQNRFSEHLYISYNMAITEPLHYIGVMRSKWIPWMDAPISFRGIAQKETNECQLYPNPSNGKVNLSINGYNDEYQWQFNILEMNGRTIKSGYDNVENISEAIEQIPNSGNYYIQLLGAETSYTIPFTIIN